MGLNKYTLLMPYIKIPLQYKDLAKDIKTCGQHENYGSDKFCPLCGGEIFVQKISEKAIINIDDLIHEVDVFFDHIIDDNIHVFQHVLINNRKKFKNI